MRSTSGRVRAFAHLCSLLLAAGATCAEDSPIVTDRPDQTESSEVVPLHHWQLEAGVLHSENVDDETETLDAVGQTLLRYGLVDWLELRAAWEGWQSAEVDLPELGRIDEDGAGDAAIGAKLALADEAGWRPQMAVLAHVSLPVGEGPFTTDAFDPSFRFLISHGLGERFSLGANLGAEWATFDQDDGRETTLSRAVWTLSLGASVGEKAGLFIEAFGDDGLSDEGGPATSVDGGFTYQFRPNVQLDASLGTGVSDLVDELWFVGAGLSWRWPD